MARGDQAHTKASAIFYMKSVAASATFKTRKTLASSPELKNFLLSIGDADPACLEKLLKSVIRVIAANQKSKGQDKGAKRKGQEDKAKEQSKRRRFTHGVVSIISDTQTEDYSGEQGEGQDGNSVPVNSQGEYAGGHEEEDDENTITVISRDDNNGHFQGNQNLVLNTQAPTRYKLELGITRAVPEMMGVVKMQHGKREASSNPTKLQAIFEACTKLDFCMLQSRLSEFLKDRLRAPGSDIEMPLTWTAVAPPQILEALCNIKVISIETKLHFVYAQMKLFSSVEAEKLLLNTYGRGRKSPAMAYLEKLARDKASPGSKEWENIFNGYHEDYLAGKKWSQIADWFGGSGTVFVFLIAGISSWWIARGWDEDQRSWLKHISSYLPSVLALVEALGPNSLETYCRNGYLAEEVILKIEAIRQANDSDEDSDPQGSDSHDSDSGSDSDAGCN